MSGNMYINDDKEQFIFCNQLSSFPSTPSKTFETLNEGTFTIATVKDIEQNHDWLKVDRHLSLSHACMGIQKRQTQINSSITWKETSC